MADASKSAARAPWANWLMLILFTFIAFESVLLAAALKGPWFILFAPGAVCALKAYDTWRLIRPQPHADSARES